MLLRYDIDGLSFQHLIIEAFYVTWVLQHKTEQNRVFRQTIQQALSVCMCSAPPPGRFAGSEIW